MTERLNRHRIVAKWKTDFPNGMTPYFFKVEGEKFIWVFVRRSQTHDQIRLSAFYDGPVFKIEDILENEKNFSHNYQMVSEFVSAVQDQTILPCWTNLTAVEKCECGSESVYGPNTAHSSWCPKH